MAQITTRSATPTGEKGRLPVRLMDTLHLQAQALSAGLHTIRFPRRVLMAGRPDSIGELAFLGTQSTQTALSGKAFANDRRIVGKLLRAADIPTPRGRMFSSSRFQAAARWAATIGYPVIVRPRLSMSDHSNGTIANDDTQVAAAMEELGGSARAPSFVVVDEFVTGRMFNLLVLGSDVASVLQFPSKEGATPGSQSVDQADTMRAPLSELAANALATIPGLGYGSVTVLEPGGPGGPTGRPPMVIGVNAAPSLMPHFLVKSDIAEDLFRRILAFHANLAGFQLEAAAEVRDIAIQCHDVTDHPRFYAWLRLFGEQSGVSVQTPVKDDVEIVDAPAQAALSGPPLRLAECLVRAVELPDIPGRVGMIETSFH